MEAATDSITTCDIFWMALTCWRPSGRRCQHGLQTQKKTRPLSLRGGTTMLSTAPPATTARRGVPSSRVYMQMNSASATRSTSAPRGTYARPSIDQTDFFAERYEADARLNLMRAAEELV